MTEIGITTFAFAGRDDLQKHHYVSPTQINFQVPFEAPASGNVPVVVKL